MSTNSRRGYRIQQSQIRTKPPSLFHSIFSLDSNFEIGPDENFIDFRWSLITVESPIGNSLSDKRSLLSILSCTNFHHYPLSYLAQYKYEKKSYLVNTFTEVSTYFEFTNTILPRLEFFFYKPSSNRLL